MSIKRYSYHRPLNIEQLFGANTLTLTATVGLKQHHRQTDNPTQLHLFTEYFLHTYPGEDVCKGIDEMIALNRAINKSKSQTVIPFRKMCLQDTQSLLQTLKELDAHNVNLHTTPNATDYLGDSFQQRFHNSTLFDMIQTLQEDWKKELTNITWLDSSNASKVGKVSLESMILKQIPIVVQKLKDTNTTLILDGFSFLRPLQVHLLRECQNNNVDVIILQSKHHHRSMTGSTEFYKRIWQHHPSLGTLPPLVDQYFQHPSTSTTLHHIQREGFSGIQHTKAIDSSFSVKHFMTRVEETKHLVREAVQKRQQNPTCSIAFVSRTPKVFRNLILDAVMLYDPSNLLGLKPELNVFHTPAGQFISLLYTAFSDGNTFKLTYAQFGSILLSGWFGSEGRELYAYFTLMKYRFSDCETKAEWDKQFDNLDDTHSIDFCLDRQQNHVTHPTQTFGASGRAPENFVTLKHLQDWREIFETVYTLSASLHQTQEDARFIHVKTLHSTLHASLPTPAKDSIQAQLLKNFEQFYETESIHINSDEFGETLLSLGHVDDDSNTTPQSPNTGPQTPAKIMAFEGVDGLEIDAIFMFAVDNVHSPQVHQTWPMKDTQSKLKLYMERYFFQAVIFAAKQSLHISWADVGENQTYTISPYTKEMLWQYNWSKPDATITVTGSAKTQITTCTPPKAADTYRLSDLAIYAFCPARYMFERTNPTGAGYHHEFHKRWLIQSEWLEQVFASLSTSNRTIQQIKQAIRSEFKTPAYQKHKKSLLRHMFPDVSQLTTDSVELFMASHLNLSPEIESCPPTDSYKITESSSWSTSSNTLLTQAITMLDQSTRTVIIDSPYYLQNTQTKDLLPLSSLVLRKIWLSKKYGMPSEPELNDNETGWTKHQKWLDNHTNPLIHQEWANTIRDIEDGIFRKSPSPTCKLCPAYESCLGITEEI